MSVEEQRDDLMAEIKDTIARAHRLMKLAVDDTNAVWECICEQYVSEDGSSEVPDAIVCMMRTAMQAAIFPPREYISVEEMEQQLPPAQDTMEVQIRRLIGTHQRVWLTGSLGAIAQMHYLVYLRTQLLACSSQEQGIKTDTELARATLDVYRDHLLRLPKLD